MSYLLIHGDAKRLPWADRGVDLVFGSPPYIDARLYLEDGRDLGIARKCQEWVDWMLVVTTEAIRISRGAVVWVVAGKTEDRYYQPGPEGLVWEWYRRGGCMECPCYWHRVGGVGLDLRRSQAEIARRRIEHPHAPVRRPTREEHHPLFGQMEQR